MLWQFWTMVDGFIKSRKPPEENENDPSNAPSVEEHKRRVAEFEAMEERRKRSEQMAKDKEKAVAE